ncbi:hypothetical protein QFC24_000717 [Naganishia onofrii]|uniref:Uncharacterized protein n=1 Tax=Naganishia onofrii TaxID=1851511 RepID=A0ACC2XUN3_9TREE|nr:hypothetical protein QFC24_000717 [Naganishia onofrii]
MSSDPVVYEFPFSAPFYNKGVDIGPEEHAAGRMAELRRSYVNIALILPGVSGVQWGAINENGTGSEWTIHFSEKDYNVKVLFDEKTKNWKGERRRKIGYILSVVVVQQNIPNPGHPSDPPRQVLVSLS